MKNEQRLVIVSWLGVETVQHGFYGQLGQKLSSFFHELEILCFPLRPSLWTTSPEARSAIILPLSAPIEASQFILSFIHRKQQARVRRNIKSERSLNSAIRRKKIGKLFFRKHKCEKITHLSHCDKKHQREHKNYKSLLTQSATSHSWSGFRAKEVSSGRWVSDVTLNKNLFASISTADFASQANPCLTLSNTPPPTRWAKHMKTLIDPNRKTKETRGEMLKIPTLESAKRRKNEKINFPLACVATFRGSSKLTFFIAVVVYYAIECSDVKIYYFA